MLGSFTEQQYVVFCCVLSELASTKICVRARVGVCVCARARGCVDVVRVLEQRKRRMVDRFRTQKNTIMSQILFITLRHQVQLKTTNKKF